METDEERAEREAQEAELIQAMEDGGADGDEEDM